MSTVREEDSQRSKTPALNSVQKPQPYRQPSVFHQGREWKYLTTVEARSEKTNFTADTSLAIIADYLNINPSEIPCHIDDLMKFFGLEDADLKEYASTIREDELENKIKVLAGTITRQKAVRAYTGINQELALHVDAYVRNLLRSSHAPSGITRVVFGQIEHSIELTIDSKRKIVIFKKGYDEVLASGENKAAVAARDYFKGDNIVILKLHVNVNLPLIKKNKIIFFNRQLFLRYIRVYQKIEFKS